MALPVSQPVLETAAASTQIGLSLWDAAILGVVEGITEYLPISSTGHLILASGFLGLNEPAELKAAVDAFNIVIQGGAILAVLGLYFPRVLDMLRGLLGRSANGRRLLINLFIAFLPAGVFGFLFAEAIESKLFNTPVVLAMLALGGVYMIVLDVWLVGPRRREDRAREAAAQSHEPSATPDQSPAQPEAGTIDAMTWRGALVIGLLQCVAMVPGTSRSMMTITGGVLAGLRPKDAAEFSFLLGLPTLGGACVYKATKEVLRTDGPNMFEVIGFLPILVGMLVATISAMLAVRWLVAFLNTHGLAGFGVYRLLLAAVLGGLLLTNTIALV